MKTVEVELPGRAERPARPPRDRVLAARRFARTTKVEPALAAVLRPGLPYEWQYVATRENEVPADVLRAASTIKIAVVDTGADVTHPDLAAKAPETWDVVHHRTNVIDRDGHGTFVSALAAGSVSNDEGIAGFGGDAQLLMVRAVGASDTFSDVDEAAAIVYAVDHGAKIVNLSLGGVGASELEQRAIEYAVAHNVLLVAAAGNEYQAGNPIEYPAAALQPPGLERPGRRRALRRSQHDGRQARVLLEHRHSDLARGSRRERVRRDRGRIVARVMAALTRSPAPGGPLRVVERHVVRDARGRRRGRARLGRQPGSNAQQVAAMLKATASGGKRRSRLGVTTCGRRSCASASRSPPRRGRLVAELPACAKPDLTLDGAPRRDRWGAPPSRPLATSAPGRHARLPDSITLQVRRGGAGTALARTTTRGAAEIRWTFGLRPGRVRASGAVYRGRWDLHAAIRLKAGRVR